MNLFRTTPEKPVKFMGIAFRDQGHIRYFLLSGSITLLFLMKLAVEKMYTNAIVPLSISICTAIVAVVMTRFGTRTTNLYSKDCIWWNLFLAGVSLLALLLAKHNF